MQTFPETAEAFYALRDDRTNRCVESASYADAHVALVIDPTRAVTPSGKAMAAASSALLAMWCRRVTIVGEEVKPLLEAMRDADPFGDFRAAAEVPSDAGVVLRVGGLGQHSEVRIDAAGWTAAIGSGDRTVDIGPDHAHPIGAVAAACFGVAEVFRRAVGLPPTDLLRLFDCYRLAWSETPASAPAPTTDVGEILLIGAGAVGSCAAYVHLLCGFAGRFDVVDFDWIKAENFNRSPLFTRRTHNARKAKAVADALTAGGSPSEAFVGDWDAFVRAGQLGNFRGATWVPVANEFGVRRSVQRNHPPRSVHASTSPNWGVNFARHARREDGCILCRIPVEVVDAAALGCSTAQVKTATGAQVDAALPFVSLFAGVCIAAELARRVTPGYVEETPNYLLMDFFPPGFGVQAVQRLPLPECSCTGEWELSRAINASARLGAA